MSNQTGPRTDEGKKTSSQNNRQHGLSTANIIVSPSERPVFDQMESDLRDEIVPAGPLEDFAFQRLITARWQIEKCRQSEAALRALESPHTNETQNEANLEKIHRYYQRWEGSYNSALRQLRLLQTDRALIAYNNGKIPEALGPLADLPKIEHFARRIAKQYTFDDHVRKELNTQLAVIQLEKQIRELGAVPITGHAYLQAAQAATKSDQNPERERRVADPRASASPTESTSCETKHPQVGLRRRGLGEVGRNSPCPCGSGIKYKRCCGVNAPPILNHAA